MFGKSKIVFSIKRDVSKVDDNNLMPKELQFFYYENSEACSIIVQVQWAMQIRFVFRACLVSSEAQSLPVFPRRT